MAAITLVAGVLFLLLAVFRLGWIARFLSKPVITGFLAGAAVDVVIGELPKLTGTSADGVNAWRELGSWIGSLGDVHWTTLLVGVVSLGVILGVRFLCAGGAGGVGAGGRRDPRLVPVRSRSARGRAGRTRAARAYRRRSYRASTCSASSTPPSASPRLRCS